MKSILSTCALFLVLPWKLAGETTLRPNSEEAHSLKSTSLHNGTSKGHEITTRVEESTISLSKNQQEYTTVESKNVLSSKMPRQTSKHQHFTSMSHAEHQTHTMTISTGERRSSSNPSSLPIIAKLTQKNTAFITNEPFSKNMLEEVNTTREDKHTLHNLKSTTKGPDRQTQGNKTTTSAEVKLQTDILTHFQKTPEVITNQSVQTSETMTTKWSSLPQEKESAHLPTVNNAYSNGTFWTTVKKRIETSTYPLKASTNTGLSTGLSPTVNGDVGTTDTDTTETMATKATYKITIKTMITEGKHPKPNSETIPTTQTDNTKTTVPQSPNKDNYSKSHPGQIVAALIGSILCLMFVAFIVVLVRNHQMKKKQRENPDWAGPSPFIETDIHPNLPTINEDEPLHCQESKRFSLHSFLPQQLSKRFSMLSPAEEEIPLEDTQVSSTFGQRNVHPLNEKAAPDQNQTQEANNSPAELSSDSNVPETVSHPPAPGNNDDIQTTTKLYEDVIPSPPAETDSATPAPFEDVDLNLSLDKNTESTTPANDIRSPSPPPIAPS